MRIAFYSKLLLDDQKTGIEWTAENILQSLKKYDSYEYQMDYFTMWRSKKQIENVDKYEKYGFKLNSCNWFHDVLYKLIWNIIPIPYSWFFGKKADVTQFFNYYIPPGVKGKKVTFVYDMVYKAFPETVRKKTQMILDINLKKSCKRADKIITISEFSKQEIMKYLDVEEEKIVVMPCGVDLSIYHNKYNKNEINLVKQKFNIIGEYFLYLGTLEPRKNIDRIIEAYSILKASSSHIPKLVLAGRKGWLYESIFEKVRELKLEEDVIFTGYIESYEVPLLLNGAMAFIFPSIYEGFGLPPLEAMACGTPVIVSNTASLPEVVGETGLQVDPYDIERIKEAMERLVKDVELRHTLSTKGMKRAQRFTWENSVKILLGAYKSLEEKLI